MTQFGVDISEWQKGINLNQVAAEGFSFAIVRTNDGLHRDLTYQQHMRAAEAAGLITASYIYLRNPSEGASIPSQVQASLAVMGDVKRPVWLDVETPAGLHIDHLRQAKQLFEQAGVRVVGVYTGQYYWPKVQPAGSSMTDLGAFWLAWYASMHPGYASALYGGDGHRNWTTPVGGATPSLWQFTSAARVAGMSVDANAFRGTTDELRALFYGTPAPTQPKPKEAHTMNTDDLILDQLAGPGKGQHRFDGWNVADLFANAAKKNFKTLTAVEMLAVLVDRTTPKGA